MFNNNKHMKRIALTLAVTATTAGMLLGQQAKALDAMERAAYELFGIASVSGLAIGSTSAKAFGAEKATPEMIQNTVNQMQHEIGAGATTQLIQAMNNCNDPESIIVPNNAHTTKDVVTAYGQVFEQCLAK